MNEEADWDILCLCCAFWWESGIKTDFNAFFKSLHRNDCLYWKQSKNYHQYSICFDPGE